MLSIQVNSHTILKNITWIKKRLKNGTRICAVIKDDAYGFGLTNMGKLLNTVVDYFAVINLKEGITLRENGVDKDILLLGICEDIATAIKYNLIITVENLTQARFIARHKLQPRIHIAVNTGMNRFGLSSVHELRETLQILKQTPVEGLYTHFAYESNHPDLIQIALEKFKKFTQICQKYFPNILLHAGCSGIIDYPIAHFDMVRIGKALYGGFSGTHTAFKITSQIVATKKIKPGSTVGYGGEFVAKKASVIGIVSGGYAQGIPTQFSGRIKVLVGKQKCPVIGRVCMDYFFVDVSKVAKPIGQTVTIIAPHSGQNLLDIAKQSQMITCDLLLRFAAIRHQN